MRFLPLLASPTKPHSRREPGSTCPRASGLRSGSRLPRGMRCGGFLAAFLLALAAARPAVADGALRVQRPLDLVALPLLVMEHEHLIERVAEAMGLGAVTVTWSSPDQGRALEALPAGESDLVVADLAPFLLAADAADGTSAGVRAVGALAQRPYVLVTRNPAVPTI